VITSRRDYLLRLIDEVTRLLARVVFKHRGGDDQEALQTVVQGFQRLFNLPPEQLFQMTPDHHFVMLTLDEPPDVARDKVLLYAALSTEAGKIYSKLGNQPIARATLNNALRFTLKARQFKTDAPLPDFAPKTDELVALLGADALDPETKALLGGAA
jgi:hypothetical protein